MIRFPFFPHWNGKRAIKLKVRATFKSRNNLIQGSVMEETQTPEAENPTVAEESNVTTSPVEETTTSDDSVEQPETDEQSEHSPQLEETNTDATVSPERKQERPAERRIRQLSGELKQANEQLNSLQQQVQLPPQTQSFEQFVQGRDSIDPQELDNFVKNQTAQAQAQSNLQVQMLRDEIARKDAISQYDRDETDVSKQLEELPADLANEVEKTIIDAFQKSVYSERNGVKEINPNVRLAEVAKPFLEIAKRAAETGKSQTSEALATAADNAALTPTSTSTKEDKSFEELSVAEMEAKLKAQGYFRK